MSAALVLMSLAWLGMVGAWLLARYDARAWRRTAKVWEATAADYRSTARLWESTAKSLADSTGRADVIAAVRGKPDSGGGG